MNSRFSLLLAALLAVLVGSSGLRALSAESEIASDLPALKRRSLAVMQDVVPTPVALKTIARVSVENDRALWGRIFGDNVVGAVVAVQMQKLKPDQPREDADLCLLLWEDGWRFEQWAGKVSANENYDGNALDWSLKERRVTHTFYIISGLNLNACGARQSWFCDPEKHRLVPTGWRTGYLPSISGDTITFFGWEKPGYSPLVWEIHRFDGTVGPLLAAITGEDANHQDRGRFITVPTPDHHGWETWRIWDRSREFHFQRTVYGLARIRGDDINGTPEGEATAEFSRTGENGGTYVTSLFLEWRLTGLSTEALEGKWDQDARRNFPKPEWVKIAGDAEAVERFSWPPIANEPEGSRSPSPVPQQ